MKNALRAFSFVSVILTLTSGLSRADTGCLEKLSSPSELAVIERLGVLNEAFAQGTLSRAERDARLQALISSGTSGDRSQAARSARAAAIYSSNILFAYGALMPSVLRQTRGQAITGLDLDVIRGLGIRAGQETAYLDVITRRFGKFYSAIDAFGVRFDATQGWLLTQARWSAIDSMSRSERATLSTALSILVSPEIADLDRTRKIIAAKERFDSSVERFLVASKKASGFWELLRNSRDAANEAAINAAYGDMFREQRLLVRELKVSTELRQAIFAVMNAAHQIDRANWQRSIARLDMAIRALRVAPLLPVALYAAPAVGSLIGMSGAVATSAQVMAAFPIAFALTKGSIVAAVRSSRGGGSWLCEVGETLADELPGALYTAPFMALIPTGAALVAAAPLALGAVSATTAPMIYGGVNVGVALYFTVELAKSGVHGAQECHAALQSAKSLARQGREALAHSVTTQAIESCGTALIDLGFAIALPAEMARRSFTRPSQTSRATLFTEPIRTAAERARATREILGREPTRAELTAVERAHRVGEGEIGRDGTPAGLFNYTQAQIRRKVEILTDAGLSKNAIRSLLDHGVVGKAGSSAAIKKKVKAALDQLKATQAEQLAKFEAEMLPTMDAPVAIPDGIKYKKSYEGIREFLGDGKKVFERLQELELEVTEGAIRSGKTKPAYVEALLNKTEKKHGFKKVIDLEKRAYSAEEWRAMLQEGAQFRDWTFDNTGRNGPSHGMLTHRLQWLLVMREMERAPASFRSGSNSPTAAELFKTIGEDAQIGAVWDILFDSFGSRFTCPEFFRGRTHEYWPGIGEWS